MDSVVQNCVDKAIKQKSIEKPRLRKLKPWITEGIIRSIRTRDKLSKRVKNQPFNVNLRTFFNRYKNTLNNLIKTTKKTYYRSKLNESQNNPKQFWKIINELAGKGKNNETFPVDKFMANRPKLAGTDVRLEVANEFNKYFSKVGENLARAIDTSGEPVVRDEDHGVQTIFNLRTITEDQLLHYVTSLRGASAPGYDCVSAGLLKQHFNVLKQPLLHIVNTSMQTGEFPDVFKIAKVIPIYKSNDVTSTSNYRPISLLSVFTKVLEKIVKDQLYYYLESNLILAGCQYGFRKNKI